MKSVDRRWQKRLVTCGACVIACKLLVHVLKWWNADAKLTDRYIRKAADHHCSQQNALVDGVCLAVLMC
jgi:hypothetical protein